MRARLRVLALTCLLLLSAVPGVASASHAEETTLLLAVPTYVPLDGDISMVVFTGGRTQDVTDTSCGVAHENVAVYDTSTGYAGRVTEVLVDAEMPQGTRVTNFIYFATCRLQDGAYYIVYSGTVERGEW